MKPSPKLDQIRALRETRTQKSRGGVEGHGTPGQTPPDSHARRKGERFESSGVHATASVEPGPRDQKQKRGRPRIDERSKTLKATKPWEAEGMSRRTWYRRKQEAK